MHLNLKPDTLKDKDNNKGQGLATHEVRKNYHQ